MRYQFWGPKPSVAEQRRQAEKKLAQMRKGGKALSPVAIDGRTIAVSFWGKSWCTNLERYSDYANRLPRGRSYVRHGCVIDLQIAKGEITAQVNGSSLYQIRISIAPVSERHWSAICGECSSSIDSMVELLQGRLAKTVMDRVCRTGDGLFPAPKDIKLSCSCPDGASMCKHVAATLYGVGARLDARPELLFLLRGVDQQELIARAGSAPARVAARKPAKAGKVLADADLASVFGLDMATPERGARATSPAPSFPPAAAGAKTTAAKRTAPVNSGRTKGKQGKPAKTKARATSKRHGLAGTKPPRKPAPRKDHSPISIT